MERKTHYFYALKLPNEVKSRLKEACHQLQKELSFSKWVHHEDYHITLAFLGYARKDQLEASIHHVKEALSSQQSFPLSINQLGVFGKKDSPRIFWAGAEESQELNQVRNLVYSACEEAEFPLDKRAFHPHITLARKWSMDMAFSNDLLINNNPFKNNPEHFIAMEIVLYQTHLDKVPKYEEIERFSLK
jgi:RNA 2',3'-cyclic 3'-phosphodiesterase